MVELTPRQLDCLRLAARGKTNTAIAVDLGISEQTVKNHLWLVYKKVFRRNPTKSGKRTLAVLYALRTGQISWREV